MRIVTWNVNSVRVRLPRLLALLRRHEPDVVCLQELKVTEDTFPRAEILEAGYHPEVLGQRTYNGVAILTRGAPPADVVRGFDGDPIPEQARVISATVGDLRVVCAYVVNGKALDTDDYRLKLAWLDAFGAWIRARHAPGDRLVVCGDFNVAPDDRDVYDAQVWKDRVLVSEPERARIRDLCVWGLRDLHRVLHDQDGGFSWWDYRQGAFHRGWGLRLDLLLATEPLAARCRAVTVDREERKPTSGESKPSDHAPVLADIGL